MAENTTTRVVEVQVDNAEAIKLIADYNAKIEESTAKEKALREAIKKKGEATAADREELAKLRAEQTAYKRELREVEKEVQNNIKAAREEEGSNRKLRAELSNLTKQYDSMSAAMQKSAEGEALKKQINEITDALLESEEGTQRFYRNVGNYPDIKPLETQLGVIRQQLAQMKYEGKETTQEYQDLLGVAANMKDALALYNNSIIKISIETKNGTFVVLSKDIVFIEANNHKTIVHVSDNDYLCIHNINYWLNQLHMPSFFQSHRSFIVNLEHVSSFDHSLIYLCNNQYQAYLTRRKYTQFKDAFLLYLESRR